MRPRVAVHGAIIGVLVQGTHVFGIKLFFVRRTEVRANKGEIETNMILLGGLVNAVDITDPLSLDQLRNRTPDNAHRFAFDLLPAVIQAGVTNNVGLQIFAAGYLLFLGFFCCG